MNEGTKVLLLGNAHAAGAGSALPDVPTAGSGIGRRVALATLSFTFCFAAWGTNSARSAGSERQAVNHLVRVTIVPAGANGHRVSGWRPSAKLRVYNGDTITWLFINSGTKLKAGVDHFRWNEEYKPDHGRRNPFKEQVPFGVDVDNGKEASVKATVWVDPEAFKREGNPTGLSFKYDIVDVTTGTVLFDPEIEVRP